MQVKKAAIAVVALCLALLWGALPAAGATWYVDLGAVGQADGTSWTDAFTTVQDGIDAAGSGDEVWVKAGTYNECITLESGVGLYGGFAGAETQRSQRDAVSNVTTLDGTGGNDSVVTSPVGATSSTVIDGFTITGGTGKLESSAYRGGGIYCHQSSPTISNNTIESNCPSTSVRTVGKGIYCSFSSPTISYNEIRDHDTATTTDSGGAGIFCYASYPIIEHNRILSNNTQGNGGALYFSTATSGTATVRWNTIQGNSGGTGGGIYSYGTNVAISNNQIVSNSASADVGGICCSGGTAAISNNVVADNSCTSLTYGYGGVRCDSNGSFSVVNNTIVGNTAVLPYGGGVFCYNTSADISNNIVAFNSSGVRKTGTGTVTLLSNCVYGNTSNNYYEISAGATDIQQNPALVDPTNGDYRLTRTSPCVDAGSSAAPGLPTTDINGLARPIDGDVNGTLLPDIGAYEYVDTTAPSTPTISLLEPSHTSFDGASWVEATWGACTDTESGIAYYKYAISNSTSLQDIGNVRAWDQTPDTHAILHGDFSMAVGTTYYFTVVAVNKAGLESVATTASASCVAGGVQVDLLGGYGDFEWGGNYAWSSLDTSGLISWQNQSSEWHTPSGYVWGINAPGVPTANYSIAADWRRTTGPGVDPAENTVCQISSGTGISGSNSQYIAAKGDLGASTRYIWLVSPPLVVNNSNVNDLHAGDKVTFHIDRFWMSDYTNLPAGCSVAYKIAVYRDDTWASEERTLTLTSQGSPGSDEVSYTIPSGVTSIRARIAISAQGDLEEHQPGICVDGARLWVKREGATGENDPYVDEMVAEGPSGTDPARVSSLSDRGIKTSRMFLNCTDSVANGSSNANIYTAAQSYDYVMLGEYFASCTPRLKYYNPDLKVFLYLDMDVRDDRLDGRDVVRSVNPISISDVLSNHTDWLYDDGNGDYICESGYPGRTYYTVLENQYFQDAWTQGAIDNVQLNHADGLWIDMLGLSNWDLGNLRAPEEPQQFAHAAVGDWRNAGIPVIANCCSEHLDEIDQNGLTGSSKIDPWWNAPSGSSYLTNTPSTTIEGMQQEYAFLKPTSGYSDESHWLRCLSDMDKVEAWNTATGNYLLDDGEQRWLHGQATSPSNTASGLDGWVHFGLCSYLLAQNAWTTFGCTYDPSSSEAVLVDPGYALVKRLGAPTGEHTAFDNDEHARYRLYAGGVVVVNADPSNTHSFVLPFRAKDENGTTWQAGSAYTVPVHSGRIFLRY